MNDVEINQQLKQISITNSLLGNFSYKKIDMDNHLKDTRIFPNEMSNEIASRFPNSVVFTSEFDFYRRGSEELAQLLHKNARLVEFCVHPGTIHGFYFSFEDPMSELFWKDQKIILQKFLI